MKILFGGNFFRLIFSLRVLGKLFERRIFFFCELLVWDYFWAYFMWETFFGKLFLLWVCLLLCENFFWENLFSVNFITITNWINIFGIIFYRLIYFWRAFLKFWMFLENFNFGMFFLFFYLFIFIFKELFF